MFIGKIDSFGIFDLTDLFKRNKKSRTRCRKVEMFEFEYIVSDGGVTVINDKKYCLSPNTFILRNPGRKVTVFVRLNASIFTLRLTAAENILRF